MNSYPVLKAVFDYYGVTMVSVGLVHAKTAVEAVKTAKTIGYPAPIIGGAIKK